MVTGAYSRSTEGGVETDEQGIRSAERDDSLCQRHRNNMNIYYRCITIIIQTPILFNGLYFYCLNYHALSYDRFTQNF